MRIDFSDLKQFPEDEGIFIRLCFHENSIAKGNVLLFDEDGSVVDMSTGGRSTAANVKEGDRLSAEEGFLSVYTKIAHWKPKMVRVDMAIDAGQFPFVKQRFNPQGQRSLFYIGRGEAEKGVDVLCETMKRTSMKLYCYGNIDHPITSLPNVVYRGWTTITPAWAVDLASQSDALINTSRSDANPTTALEAASWGFPLFMTPQSGYWPGERSDNLVTGLSLDNPDGNARILDIFNNTPDELLLAQGRHNRQIVETKYTWGRFCDTIWDGLKRFL